MVDTVRHPVFARLYSRTVVPRMSRLGADDLRARLLRGLGGTVVEVGAGDGANFALYPPEVERIVAVEPEPYLRARAAGRADERVELRAGVAERLPVESGQADAVVFCLVLCTVPAEPALAEARRVLRPGGELRFLEHVRAHEPGVMRRVQRALDATVWPRLVGGCHLGRDTESAILRAGFGVQEISRTTFPEGARGPETSIILGRAHAPAGAPDGVPSGD